MLRILPIEGMVIPIYRDEEEKLLEGWAKLIEVRGDYLPFIPSDREETDTYSINYETYCRQKWIVQWVDPKNYPNINLDFSEKISQKTIKNTKSLRNIIFYIGRWKDVKRDSRFIVDKDTTLNTRLEKNNLNEDYNKIF